jgi:hypothetical protein
VYKLCLNLAFSGMKKERFLDPRGHRWQYGPWELHARYLILQTHIYIM